MSGLWSGVSQDISFAVRVLLKDRRFTIAAVLALGLAIGVNNSVFAIINTALIRDLPFERSNRLASVGLSDGRGLGGVSYPDFLDYRASTTAFEQMAGSTNTVMNISEADRPPDRFRGTYVSANAFRTLRVKPLLGRDFVPEDDRSAAASVVIIGHAVWQTRYGGDPGVLGRIVRVNDVPSAIVGVMPPGFTFPYNNELWTPLAMAPSVQTPRRDSASVQVFGRLADGTDLSRARTEVETVAGRLAREFPTPERERMRGTVISMREDYRVRTPLLAVFMGAVALVLLVACANLANLLLARAVTRSREIAVRASLGATRFRIIRQLLTESALIAMVGGVIGALFSIYGANAVAVAFDPLEPGATRSTRPFFVDLSFDGTTYLFVGLLCGFAALACGLLPALHVSRANLTELIKEGGRGATGGTRTRRWSSALMVTEVALTLMLLASTGLLWRSFFERYTEDAGFETTHLLVMRVGLPVQKYPTPEARAAFFDRLEQRLTAIPAIASAAIANNPPLAPFGTPRGMSLDGSAPPEGTDASLPQITLVQAGDRYFDTVGLRATRGRLLLPGDRRSGEEAVVVDDTFASRFFPSGDVIGQRIRLSAPATPAGPPGPLSPPLTIVGVVRTLPNLGPPEAARPFVYVPIGALPLQGPATILVRGTDVRAAIGALREEVRALDPDLPLYAMETVDRAVARARYPVRLVGTWFTIIAGIALLLSAVGLYALAAQGVTQRTQEIGVRMALGAQESEVLWLFMRRAAAQLAIGLALGLAGVFASTQTLRVYLDQVDPHDPLTLGIVVFVLVTVGVVASVLPARRATRVDPIVALRCE